MLKEKLKFLRIQKQITQEELATALFISTDLIHNWENGNETPDEENLEKLCEFFNVDKTYFINVPRKKHKLTIILNIMSVLSLILAMAVPRLFIPNLTDISYFEFSYYLNEKLWIGSFFIAIPLFSIVFGFIKSKKYRTISCIIIGAVFGIYILSFNIAFCMKENEIHDTQYYDDHKLIEILQEEFDYVFPKSVKTLYTDSYDQVNGIIRFEDYTNLNNEFPNFNEELTDKQLEIIRRNYSRLDLDYDYNLLIKRPGHNNRYWYLAYYEGECVLCIYELILY